MKNFLGILILSLLLSTNSFAGTKKGKGDLTISENAFNHFLDYIRASRGKKPEVFILSSSGHWVFYWYCEHSGGCRAGNYQPTIDRCEDETGEECGLFARRYTIIWKNGINPGKGKVSTIKSKWSDAEIRAKFTELGFLAGSTSSNESIKPKITKKIKKKKI